MTTHVKTKYFTRALLASVTLALPLCLASPAMAAGAGDKVEAAAAAYGLAKDVIGDVSDWASGPSTCVRHFYNQSSSVWFVKSNSLGTAGGEHIGIEPGKTLPVYYNGTDMPLEITGPNYHEMYSVDGCYLEHNGNTGRAVLNEPADGDIKFIN